MAVYNGGGYVYHPAEKSYSKSSNQNVRSINSKKSYQVCWANNVPQFILEYLFSYLSLEDLRNCALVCTKWYK